MLDDSCNQLDHFFGDWIHLDGARSRGLVGADGGIISIPHDVAQSLAAQTYVIGQDESVSVLVVDE